MNSLKTFFLNFLNFVFLLTVVCRLSIYFSLSYLIFAYLKVETLVTMLPGLSNLPDFASFSTAIVWLKMGLLVYLFFTVIVHLNKSFKSRKESAVKIAEICDGKVKDK